MKLHAMNILRQGWLLATFASVLLASGCGTGREVVTTSPEAAPSDPEGLTAETRAKKQVRLASLSPITYSSAGDSRTSDRFPDIKLIDQHGRSVNFYTDLVQDQCVCIVYFYTRCTGSCPTTTQVVRRLRKDLGEIFDHGELRFISLTLEPDVDTPEELRAYMDRYQIKDDETLPEWTYATGVFDEVDGLRRSLGIYDLDPVIDADKTEHATILTFGNDRLDRWAALPIGMDYDQLKTAMIRIMGNSPRQRYSAVAKHREFAAAE